MLKMKVDPTMCMKTKGHTTKCQSKKQTFSANGANYADKNDFREAICGANAVPSAGTECEIEA
jgi:hypothetical protein